MFHTATGSNNRDDSFTTGANACQEAFMKLGSDSAQAKLVIVFSSIRFDQKEMLRGVRSVSGNIPLVGASSAGNILSSGPTRQPSVSVMVIATDTIKFFPRIVEYSSRGARKAGQQLAEDIQNDAKEAGEDLSLFMMFLDVLEGNGSAVVRGALDTLGEHFPVVGGAAGDDFQFKKTYQYFDDKVFSGAVVGVGFSGNFSFGMGVRHGWTPIGLPKTVTRSEDDVLHELDGKPAITMYQEYFGEENARALKEDVLARLAITYPLGIWSHDRKEVLIRDPLTVDEHGSITCAAEIPEGTEVRLMVGSTERAIEVAGSAADTAKKALGGRHPAAVFIFDCIARKKLMGDFFSDEIHTIRAHIGEDVPVFGFYTYGEVASLDARGHDGREGGAEFHNETVAICVLGE